jgi:hypothetical protein
MDAPEGLSMAGEYLYGLDDKTQMQTEKALNKVPHGEVVYGSSAACRVLDPLVRRNRH